jgi:hypothetical protein
MSSENPGAALVALRWAKTTKEERSEVARKLNEKRWGKKRKRARKKVKRVKD